MGFIIGVLLHRNKLKALCALILGLLILAFGVASINPQVAVEALLDFGWTIGVLFNWFGVGCGVGVSMLYDSLRDREKCREML